VGINYYSRLRAGLDLDSPKTMFFRLSVLPNKPQGDRGIEEPYGEAYPKGLHRAVKRFTAFNKPIYILENGVPDRQDRIRPWVMTAAVKQMRKLLAEGVDLRGYFHWSLTDNFEWNEGWHLRFGIIEIDPHTQARKPRPSADLYAQIIRESRNGFHATGESAAAAKANGNGSGKSE
jgi:beta-glucosidase